MAKPKQPADPKLARQTIRQARRKLPAPYRSAASAKICEAFAKLDAFESASSVAGFLAFDGEADPLGLMINAFTLGKDVFVPMVIEKSKPLMFAPWTPTTSMKKNRFGILEPDVPADQYVAGEALDFVVTPLVAFDANCHRIGVGGGFYDRTFAHLHSPKSDRSHSTQMVGFAFEMQRVDRIEPQEWDVKLDSVITEYKQYS
jgi:5-formyltetrahydrofolate cyclo-ligase